MVESARGWGDIPGDWPLILWRKKTNAQTFAYLKTVSQTLNYEVQKLADQF